jgi:hypothetical protein
MKIKWQWFIGGKKMFWLSILLFMILIASFIITYIIDPIGNMVIEKITTLDITRIKTMSEEYISNLNIKIDKPIVYRFVEFRSTNKKDEVLLGTFHEWNGKYYIDIRSKLVDNDELLFVTVKHETRHMIVTELYNQNILNLTKYTEEIAVEKNTHYNNLFDSGVYLLKLKQKEG